jgi:hypothetical protein
MTYNQPTIQHPERGRHLQAVAQIRRIGDEPDYPYAAIPLFEGNLEQAVDWLRANHRELVKEQAKD